MTWTGVLLKAPVRWMRVLTFVFRFPFRFRSFCCPRLKTIRERKTEKKFCCSLCRRAITVTLKRTLGINNRSGTHVQTEKKWETVLLSEKTVQRTTTTPRLRGEKAKPIKSLDCVFSRSTIGKAGVKSSERAKLYLHDVRDINKNYISFFCCCFRTISVPLRLLISRTRTASREQSFIHFASFGSTFSGMNDFDRNERLAKEHLYENETEKRRTDLVGFRNECEVEPLLNFNKPLTWNAQGLIYSEPKTSRYDVWCRILWKFELLSESRLRVDLWD